MGKTSRTQTNTQKPNTFNRQTNKTTNKWGKQTKHKRISKQTKQDAQTNKQTTPTHVGQRAAKHTQTQTLHTV